LALRRGRRIAGATTVLHVVQREATGAPRFGFVVAKSVGNAVTRNQVKRRLRAAAAETLPSLAGGLDVVVRALPGSGAAAWTTLHAEIIEGVSMGMDS